MTLTERAWPYVPGSSTLLTGSDWKHAGFDDDAWTSPYSLVDLDLYNAAVLQLNPATTEDDVDDRVALEAKGLGLLPIRPASGADGILNSISSATLRSNSFNQGRPNPIPPRLLPVHPATTVTQLSHRPNWSNALHPPKSHQARPISPRNQHHPSAEGFEG